MWDTIKKIIEKKRGTCIIIEDGKPVFAVVPFDDYQKLLDEKEAPAVVKNIFKDKTNDQELLEKINEEITNWKAKQSEKETEINLDDVCANDEIRIENLPII